MLEKLLHRFPSNSSSSTESITPKSNYAYTPVSSSSSFSNSPSPTYQSAPSVPSSQNRPPQNAYDPHLPSPKPRRILGIPMPYFLHILAFLSYTVLFIILHIRTPASLSSSSSSSSSSSPDSCKCNITEATKAIYSPANEIINYEQWTFDPSAGFPYHNVTNGKSIYTGEPSRAIDAEWEKFQVVNLIQLSPEEAAQLHDPTAIHKNGKHVVSIDVLHQLHCLNSLRMGLRPDKYKPLPGASTTPEEIEAHRNHCIDSIRLSLMCSSDVAPISLAGTAAPYSPVFKNQHSCRNFDAVYRWAESRAAPVTVN